MVAIWRKIDVAAKPHYEPTHYNDERLGARSTSTPTQHRGARDQNERRARFKTNER
jgi:hypothetical protein